MSVDSRAITGNSTGRQREDIGNRYAAEFKMNTAAWIDVNTNFSRELFDILLRVPSWCHMRHNVPVVISCFYGRDMPGGVKERIKAVEETIRGSKFQRRFTLKDHWIYETSGGAYMLTVAGVVGKGK